MPISFRDLLLGTMLLCASCITFADTALDIQNTEQQIEQLSAEIKTANRNKDKESANRLREERIEAQRRLRELKKQQREEKKQQEKQTKRAAAEAEWETYPVNKQLCTAVEYNRFDLVRKVMESNPIDLRQPNDACLYPLGEAVTRGFADIADYLLQKGSPLFIHEPIMNAKISAMDAAAGSKEDRTDILNILKRHGATPYDSVQGNLAGAVIGDDKDAKNKLKQDHNMEGDMFTLGASLTKSLQKGHVNNIRWLLANGSKPEESMTGRTALMIAVDSNNLEKVKLLVEAGADVNRRGINFESVLAHAERHHAKVSKKHQASVAEIIEYLKSKGATYSDQDRKPAT
ncbi:MAG: hypothetical protein CMK89_18325 [Pseudomonadales bacterium]|nr:hypothetical protein [Pseudomonadales bacterium]RLU03628.1 MAG: hypothetical protein D9N11_03130 [Ketobacter sp.]